MENLIELLKTRKMSYAKIIDDLKHDMKIATKLGFKTEFQKLETEKNYISEIIELIDEIQQEIQNTSKTAQNKTIL